MKKIKSLCKYVLIFIIMVVILLSVLVLSAKLPREKVKANIRESVDFFKENNGITMLLSRREYTYIQYCADATLLGIIYNLDEDNPLESVLWAKFYEKIKADSNKDFIKSIEENLEPNQQYLRYWHGGMAVVTPLLIC